MALSKLSDRGVYQSRRTFLKSAAGAAGLLLAPASWRAMAMPNNQAGTQSWREFEFIPPHQWQVQPKPEQVILTQTPDLQGCMIQILPLQIPREDLQTNALALFDLMYRGWNYSVKGAAQYRLVKGYLPSGHEFFLKEASMNIMAPDGRYLTEDGVALVVMAGAQMAIIGVRHRSTLAHINCQNQYNTWRRFFNSINLRGVSPTMPRDDASTRIIGAWGLAEHGAASGEYVFAANGQYSSGGALGQSWTTRDAHYRYLHQRTYSFQGEGRYTITGNRLSLARHRGGIVEQALFRFEQVSHGGSVWKDRLCMLKQDGTGQLYEVRYEKK